MRFPQEGDKIDFAAAEQMFDRFLESGFSYVDTAYGYHDFQAEIAVRDCLVRRHPRERFELADKMPLWFVKEPADLDRLFNEQLEKTGAGYFDYYLLHSLTESTIALADQYGAWEYLLKQKERGLIRHLGFSFHDTAAVLDAVLTKHPEAEFVQLQLNYADWESPRVQSRLCYEVTQKHGKQVVVMEPVRGGSLAALPESARELLLAAAPDASIASWALRFVASLPGVMMVLSGMSDLAQMNDNLATFSPLNPLTGDERALIAQVQKILENTPLIPCTRCNYCTETCPAGIPIPNVLATLNDYRRYANQAYCRDRHAFAIKGKAPASACIQCGVCVSRCPQHIDIPEHLAEAARLFE